MKKIIVAGLMMMCMTFSFSMNVMAEEQVETTQVSVPVVEASQGYSWYENNGGWSVLDANGVQVTNSWYQDADGSRYFIGSDGLMKDGLVNDNGHYYFLNTGAEGHGKMVTVDGIYHGVNLVFNHDVNSEFFGEVVSGVDGLMNAGVAQSSVVYATTSTSNSNQNTDTFPSNPAPYQIFTFKNGDMAYWDPTFNMWMNYKTTMTHLDEKSAVWDNDMAELAKQVGANMRQ